MAQKSHEKELLALETRYWEALKTRDFEQALALADDPCLVVGPTGVESIARETFRNMMHSSTHRLRNYELDNVQARELGDDVVVLAYKVREELTVDGKPVTVHAAHSSTWVKRNGRWTCALHTESIAGDPFGRDRQAA